MSNDISSVAGAVQQAAQVPENTARTVESGNKTPPVGPAAAEGQDSQKSSSPTVDSQTLASAIEKLNSLAEAQQRELKFSIDEPTGKTIVKVFDSSSQELIRQIPAKEVLELAERFSQGDTGALMHVVA